MTSAGLRFVLIGFALLLFAFSGRAQLTGGLSNMQSPPVTSQHIGSLERFFSFDEGTMEVIWGLHEEVVSAHTNAMVGFQQMNQQAQEEARQPGADVAEIRLTLMKKARDFRIAMESTRDRFFEQVRLLLSEKDLERWEAYQRRQRRESLVNIDSGIFQGAAVDVVGIVESMELTGEAMERVESLLRRYETELDAVVQKRIAMVDKFALRQIRETEEKGFDPTSSMDMYREVFTEGAEVARETVAINDRYARLIRDGIAGEMGAEFETAYREAVFPALYRPTACDRAFASVLGLEDLSDSQREEVESLRETYDRESGAIESGWADAIREFESSLRLEDVWSGRMAPSEAAEAEARRRELGASTVEKLRGILSAEQAKTLPDFAAEDWRGRALPGE